MLTDNGYLHLGPMKDDRMAQISRILLTLALLAAVIIPTVATDAAKTPIQRGGTLVRPKAGAPISAWADQVIQATARDGRARVWVYFTDKGFTTPDGFAAAARVSADRLSARALSRRAKVGRAAVEFIDLPLEESYVNQVREMGGQFRHRSRWLNAASFEVDLNRLDDIAALPFVHRIDPVIGYKRDPIDLIDKTGSQTPLLPQPTGVHSLDYGPSFAQLNQINVPAVHDLGYKGQGVLVCMLDTGYRKDHTAFAQAFAEGRVIAEYDFVFGDGNTQDEAGDAIGQHNHGTLTWSALGGASDGNLYGPAYLADFLLAKTEDTRSETPIEEDNWVAAIEWADSIGVDVTSTSLAYTDWYTYANFDGDQAVITVAADMAVELGIVVAVSNGNAGPSPGTIGAPADGDSVIAVGAVNSLGNIAGFSSRGPTYDGRIKPEVCARGVSTSCASPSNPTGFTTAGGTSLSCPLVGGAAAILLSAHPEWTPMQVREALMLTASQAATPDNTYGWGIIDVLAALNYNSTHLPGDLNYDLVVNIIDLVMEIDIVLYGSPYPSPPVSPDINLDGQVGVPDIVYLIDYLYRGGPAPQFPAL